MARLDLWVLVFAWFGAAVRHPKLHVQLNAHHPSVANCTWRTFEQPLDHFGVATGNFQQRYCVYDKFWSDGDRGPFNTTKGQKGPIFFYTGNESPVEVYVNNSGLMWEVGKRLGALLIWAEHRYEPMTHPSLSGTKNCFAYCTTAQALADYVTLLEAIKKDHNAQNAPAVAFGGSYGGMLAGWLRMKYPDAVVGSIAASAPIWGLASTLTRENLDYSAQAITRGVSAIGGATDQCMANIRAGWSLIKQVGESHAGLRLLSKAANTCYALNSTDELTEWIADPFFDMAEGNYPFESTYITYSVGPGYFPLPPWPMQVACKHLNKDFGIQLEGSAADVNYTLRLGDIEVSVDWQNAKGNGAALSENQIKKSGVLELVSGLRDAVAVWYNVSKDKECFDIEKHDQSDTNSGLKIAVPSPNCTERCPPCLDCPPCPTAYCESGKEVCDYEQKLSKTFSWGCVTENENLFLYNNDVQGVGRDMFWPPTTHRDYTVEDIVGPDIMVQGPAVSRDKEGLYGAPIVSDPHSHWLDAYYKSGNITHHQNIIWSNGALDPWSGAGVYGVGGGPTGPMVQNISADGSQIALVIELGGHHVDLFFSDANDPPGVVEARRIEEQFIIKWCQQHYDTYSSKLVVTV